MSCSRRAVSSYDLDVRRYDLAMSCYALAV